LPWGAFDQHYNQNLEQAWDWFDQTKGLTGNNGYATGRWERLRNMKARSDGPHAGEWALDEYSQRLIRDEAQASSGVPDLGPMFNGGKSVLAHDLTHATSGIPLYPAFDDAFSEGIAIIAPEDIEVTKASSSNPGDACYCSGESQLRYWFGHLAVAPSVGIRFNKGAVIGKVGPNDIGGGPHVHVGINVELLLGAGKQLEHHTNYTHGAKTVGEQLAVALEA
jgi:hypothetical protein